MKSEWNKCRKETTACNKLEDDSIKYVSSCKTGSEALKTKLKSLYRAKDMLEKTTNKTSTAQSSSSSRATVTITYTSFTINTSDTSGITNSSFFLNCVSWLTLKTEELSSSLDTLGDDTTVRFDHTSIIIISEYLMTFCSAIWPPESPRATLTLCPSTQPRTRPWPPRRQGSLLWWSLSPPGSRRSTPC